MTHSGFKTDLRKAIMGYTGFIRVLAILAVISVSSVVSRYHSARGGQAAVPTGKKAESSADAARPYGLEKRVLWETSRFRGTPDPPLPYRAKRIFPRLNFNKPTVLTNAPGTDRMFVAEQSGKIFSIPNANNPASADPFLDANELAKRVAEKQKDDIILDSVYGMTFHPRFDENRLCYVCYVVRNREDRRAQLPDGTRVSSFIVSKTDPPRADPESERLIITWLQGGHNGGCLKFGPDGCLYISTGDGGGAFPPDILNAGQDMTRLLSGVLRIDVDHEQAGRNYTIPADNPFVSLKDARGEKWAYGMRNPWKMSFDRKTGDLWVGDVGWELWELVYRVHKADNFGWSLYEGRQPVHAERQRGPTPIVPPAVEIPHTDGASVTGGFVYRGKKFPKLLGTYVFGDWETRRIWGVTVDGEKLGERREIMDPTVRIVDFAEDNDGELYLLDYDDGTIHAVVENDVTPSQHLFPRKLSDTGLFASVAEHQLAAGVLPFSVNAEQWSDSATAERFIGVPGSESIRRHARPKGIPGSMFNRATDFPKDTVLCKTLSLNVEQGTNRKEKRIETQVLHFDGRDWRGYSYEWNDEQTDATLVEASGKSRVIQVADQQSPDNKRQQTWRFASRVECLRCHNPWSENALAFNIPQLNREYDFGTVTDNQLRTYRHIGLWQDAAESGRSNNTPANVIPEDELPKLANPFDESVDINLRARSYLHAQCAHCHRNGGGGSAYVHFPYDLALAETKSLGVRPSQGTFGIHNAKVIAPGDPFRSVLYFRMAKIGPGHMPHLGASAVDERGLELIYDWIRQLPPHLEDDLLVEKLAKWEEPQSTSKKETAVADRGKMIDDLLSNPGRATLLFRAVQQRRFAAPVRQAVFEAAQKHSDAAVRDLFESFIPEELRVKRLGETVQTTELLKQQGDIERGRQLFHNASNMQCRNCHRIGQNGTELGPDLSQIGKKYDRAKLLDSLLQPSQNIDPQFVTWIVETTAGKVVTGLIVRKDATEIVLKDAQNKEHRFAMTDVEGAFPQQKSLMPELLLRDMTAQQVVDLLDYLASLK